MSILFELHFHTGETSPCAEVKAKEGIRALMDAGFQGAVVTDHYMKWWFDRLGDLGWGEKIDIWQSGYRAACAAAEGTDFRVLCGMELTFPDSSNDFLVYGISPAFLKQHPKLYELSPARLKEFADRHGLFVAQAHPFRSPCTPVDSKFLHGLEIFNGNKRHDSHNEQAEQMASEHNLVGIAGSDFHRMEDLKRGGTLLKDLPRTEEELVTVLKSVGVLGFISDEISE